MTNEQIKAELRRYGGSNRLFPWNVDGRAFAVVCEFKMYGESISDLDYPSVRWFYLIVAEALS